MVDLDGPDGRDIGSSDHVSDDPRAVHEAALATLRSTEGPPTPWDAALAAVRSRLLRSTPLRSTPLHPLPGTSSGRLRLPRGDSSNVGARSLGLLAGLVAIVILAGAWMLLGRPADPATSLPHDPAVAAEGATRGSGTSSGAGGDGTGATTTVVEPLTTTTGGMVVVHVAGAVMRPGVVTLPAGSRAVDAVDAAGGLAPGADPDRVNLAAPLVDGARLVVPLVGQPVPAEVAAEPRSSIGGPGGGAAPSGTSASSGAPVDLNTADAAMLDSLPGVGPATAAAIIAHRDERGRFESVDELLDVRGIGEAKLDALRDLVVAGS